MATLDEAATHLGAHYQTVYRWVREGQLAAVKVGNAYEVSEAELARFVAARSAPASPPPRLNVRDWDVQCQRLHDLLIAGDEPGCRKLVGRLHGGGVPVLDICERVLAPALRAIGEEWAAGTITVAEEHRASAICEWMLAPLAAPGRGRPRGTCVVATPPGELHSLPGVMATTVLRAARWRVHHLGANVPVDALQQLMSGVRADLVVFSPALPDNELRARSIAEGLPVRALVGTPGASLSDLLDQAEGPDAS